MALPMTKIIHLNDGQETEREGDKQESASRISMISYLGPWAIFYFFKILENVKTAHPVTGQTPIWYQLSQTMTYTVVGKFRYLSVSL